MLTNNLREYTKEYHQQTEIQLVKRIKNINRTNDYISLLQMFYGYFGALEQLADSNINPALVPAYTNRRKTAAIAADLHALNADTTKMAQGAQLPQIESHLQAMGAMYVMEGSTLGGKIISKMIAQKLPAAENALSFFNGYGDDTEYMWGTFKDELNKQGDTPANEKEIMEAANQTFLKFKEWIERYN